MLLKLRRKPMNTPSNTPALLLSCLRSGPDRPSATARIDNESRERSVALPREIAGGAGRDGLPPPVGFPHGVDCKPRKADGDDQSSQPPKYPRPNPAAIRPRRSVPDASHAGRTNRHPNCYGPEQPSPVTFLAKSPCRPRIPQQASDPSAASSPQANAGPLVRSRAAKVFVRRRPQKIGLGSSQQLALGLRPAARGVPLLSTRCRRGTAH
jgi:hypothetical protein